MSTDNQIDLFNWQIHLFTWQDISIWRGGRSLLANLSGQLNSGQILFVKGSNGIGKTSFLRTLSGLLSPKTGQISLHFTTTDDVSEGKPYTPLQPPLKLDHDDPAFGLNIAYLGHQNGLKRGMTLAEDLAFWGGLTQEKNALPSRITDILARLRLQDLKDRPCQLLSSGQSRRLAFARMMVVNRPIWVLDEPLVGLDQQARADVTDLMQLHLNQGGIIIVASHDPLTIAAAEYLDLSVYRGQKSLDLQIEDDWLSL